MPPRSCLLIGTFAVVLTTLAAPSAHAAATPGSGRWTTIRRRRTDGRGFFAMRVRLTRRIDYRFTWQPAAGGALRISDPRRVEPQPRPRRRRGSRRAGT
jgi:hypothetical protein